MRIVHEVSEVTLHFTPFTLVTVETSKGPYQMSIRGHKHNGAKTERLAKQILIHVGDMK